MRYPAMERAFAAIPALLLICIENWMGILGRRLVDGYGGTTLSDLDSG